jgi:putative transposase
MLKAYKYRLYPTLDQSKMIDQTIDACRLVYNLALEIKIWAHRNGTSISTNEIGRQIKYLRKEYLWIAEVNCNAMHSSLNHLNSAYNKFFNGGGFPKFKTKKSIKKSFTVHIDRRKIDWGKSTLSIPKIENIPIALSRRFSGEIRTIVVSRSSTGKYFASILVKDTNELPILPEVKGSATIGIDVGIKSFLVTSDGRSYRPNRKLKDSLRRLQCLQNRASRKKKDSNNRKKANKKVALLHEKISNQRADYIHKITTQLIRDNQTDTFVVEDLAVANMVKNRKLSQAISDVSFGEFFRQMKYKCEWYGKNLIVIDRFAPSSKRCSDCGEINQGLTLTDREWTCSCGSHHDRDLNAAKNIKYFGLNNSPEGIGVGPVESPAIAGATKQETGK